MSTEGSSSYAVQLETDAAGRVTARIGDERFEVVHGGDGCVLVREIGTSRQTRVTLGHYDEQRRARAASIDGHVVALELLTPQERARAASRDRKLKDAGGGGSVKSPMPGRVVKVLVELGQAVERGAPLVILEAMKMENEVHAPSNGVVTRIAVAAGDVVENAALLIELGAAVEA